MRPLNRAVGAVAVMIAVGLCGGGIARGQQVLEQLPSNAVGVFEVKDVGALSTKVAKLAKRLGIDQFQPQWADPLAAVMDQMGLKQGINKSGDMAIAFFMPAKQGGNAAAKENNADNADEHPPVVVLVPTDDYKSFLGNFQDVKDEGNDISRATVPKNGEKLFVTHRGKYAAASMDKALLDKHDGMKLGVPAAREVGAKDAILYFDIKALRPLLQKGIKEGRQQFEQQLNNAAAAPGGAAANPFANNPVMKKLLQQYLNAGEEIVKDTRSAAFTFNLSDTGIAAAALADFESDSYLGKLAAQVQNTDQPLLAGLPTATYFAFGGAKITAEVASQVIDAFLAPLQKDLAAKQNGQDLTKAFESVKRAVAAMKSMSFGYVAPTAPGEGFVNAVGVTHGDAEAIVKAQQEALPAFSSLLGMNDAKSPMQIDLGAKKTVDGVELQPYTMKFNFPQNDPQAMQAQQMITMLYGRNGLTGMIGAVNKETVVQVQGGDDQLVSEAIKAARNNADTLSQAPNVKEVTASLPRQRVLEYYVALDNIATAAAKFAKQNGLAIQFRLPPNLPPIGISAGTEESTVRADLFIPTKLVESVTAAAMQAFMQMNGGGGQGGGI